MKKYLKKTSFKDSADCIAVALEAAGVKTVEQLDNLPSRYGARICNEDIYSVIAEVRVAMSSTDPDVPTALRALKLDGVTEAHFAALEAAGIVTVEDAVKAGARLEEVEGVGKVTASRILARAKKEV